MSTGYRRGRRRAIGLPSWRLVHYADDFVVLINGRGHSGQQPRGARRPAALFAGPLAKITGHLRCQVCRSLRQQSKLDHSPLRIPIYIIMRTAEYTTTPTPTHAAMEPRNL